MTNLANDKRRPVENNNISKDAQIIKIKELFQQDGG